MKQYLLLILAVAFWSNINAQNIKIDSTFGENGIVTEEREETFIAPVKAVGFIDNSYLVYDVFGNNDGQGGELRKYKNSGKLDESFASGGIYTLNFDMEGVVPNFAVLDDNKIAVTDFLEDTCNVHILDKNGVLVNKFKLKFNLENIIPRRIEFLDGFLYVSGLFSDGGFKNSSFIIKTDLEGNIAQSFADNGIFKFKGEYDDNGNDFLLQGNKLLLLHNSRSSNDEGYWQKIIRLNTDGKVDESFGDNGITSFKYDLFVYLNNVVLDSELNIYVFPIVFPVVLKLDKDGNIDESYGEGGIAYKFLSNYPITYFGTIYEDAIYLFGSTYEDEEREKTNASILSYDKDGEPNKSFGNDGIYMLNTGIEDITFFTGIFDENNDILAAGNYAGSDGAIDDFRYYILTKFKNLTTSTSEISSDIEDISVYPNPIQNNTINLQVNLKNTTDLCVDLFEIGGKKIETLYCGKAVKGQNQLSLKYHSELSNGTYLLKIRSDKSVTTKKVIFLD